MSGGAGTPIDPAALRIARRVAREHMATGAAAVVLTGSHVRGEAHPESDIDIIVLLQKEPPRGSWQPYHRRGRFLVSTGWETPATVRESFRSPRMLGTNVPGWREALILADPAGAAARLQGVARRWTWDRVAAECDRWVATEITGWAEETHKLAIALDRGHATAAAYARAGIALHMAQIVALRRRILYGTENALWDLAAAAMGREWADAQSLALGTRRVSPDAGCRAALRLYALTADEVMPLLDAQQRAVVRHAISLPSQGSR